MENGIHTIHDTRYQNTDFVKALPGMTLWPANQPALNDYVKNTNCWWRMTPMLALWNSRPVISIITPNSKK